MRSIPPSIRAAAVVSFLIVCLLFVSCPDPVSGTESPAATPTFYPAGGTYTSDQSVTISCATVGATMYYTTDGSDPASSGTRQSGTSPRTVTAAVSPATTIRAVATASGYSLSAEGTASYAFIDMVSVTGGTFSMGSTTGNSDEKPVHSVTVSSFRMSKYEITQAQYEAVTGTNPSNFTGDTGRPVERVSWYDAVEFCNKLSDREGLQKVYTISGRTPASGYPITSATVTMDKTKSGYRLPTEAEWEFAAKGGNSTQGYTYAGSDTAGDVAWYSSNAGSTTHPVGGKAANELGFYDMSGNVWEWCWDWYGTYASSAQTDPTGASSGTQRVLRGGYWGNDADGLRASVRGSLAPDVKDSYLGFRPVRKQ